MIVLAEERPGGWWPWVAGLFALALAVSLFFNFYDRTPKNGNRPAAEPAEKPTEVQAEVEVTPKILVQKVNAEVLSADARGSRSGLVQVSVNSKLSALERVPDMVCRAGQIVRCKTDKGAVLSGKAPDRYISAYADSSNQCRLDLEIPDDVKELSELECTAAAYFVTDRKTLVWNDLENLNGAIQKYEGFEFEPANCVRTEDKFRVDLRHRAPSTLGFRQSLSEFELLCTDGTKCANDYSDGSAGGSLGDGWHFFRRTFKTTGKTVKQLQITFIAKARQEELQFALKKVAIPGLGLRAVGVTPGPRGATSAKADGYTVSLKNISLESVRGQSTTTIQLEIVPSGGTRISHLPFYLDAAATDDLGNALPPTVKRTHFVENSPGRAATARVVLPMPAEMADRLSSLKCKIPMWIADEVRSAEFQIPANKQPLQEPVAKDGVTLEAVSYAGNAVSIRYQVDPNAVFSSGETRTRSVELRVLDANGSELRATGGEMGAIGKSITRQFSTEEGLAAKFVVRYVAKAHPQELNVEFTDVGLPRKMGTVNLERAEPK